ncbi:MAG: ATPase inhibitor subunit zeta, partial [Pseudolabrys sp.]
AETYAKEVVLADFEQAADHDVVHKLIKDLQPKGITEQQIRAQMTEMLAEAVAQIKKSG